MTRLERSYLLVVLLALLVLLVLYHPVSALVGTAAGAAAGLLLRPRLGALRRRVDVRLGAEEAVPAGGLRSDVVLRRIGLQLAVLALCLLVTALTPLAAGRAFAALGAAVTALPAVLTAARLRG